MTRRPVGSGPGPGSGSQSRSAGSRRWRLVAALALLAGVLLALVPLAPVTEHRATYHWQSSQGPVALPLNPYRPAELTLSWSCAELTSDAGAVLSTARAADQGLQDQRWQLRLEGGAVVLDDTGQRPGWRVAGAYPCQRLELHSDERGTRLLRDGTLLAERPGDLRPSIDGFSRPLAAGTVVEPGDGRARGAPGTIGRTDPGTPPGMSATVVADTQWDSSPTTAKVVLMVLALLVLGATVVLVAVSERPRRVRVRLRGRERLWWLDTVVVLAAIGVGIVIGSPTDDDGFITQIMHTGGQSGWFGNYVRWNNAPEAPFGWFYTWYAWWAGWSWEPVWLRLLPAVVAIIGWSVARYALAPRLLPRLDPWARVVLASGFVGGWLVFGNSLRPEIWFASGLAVVSWCVLVALERRSGLLLLIGALVAAAVAATGPVGAVALTPFVVSAPALWRWLRPDPVRGIALGLGWLACLGVVVPLMFGDQSLASVASANRVRTDYGPIFPWWMEPIRYWRLLHSLAARQVVAGLGGLALALVGWLLLASRTRGIRRSAGAGAAGPRRAYPREPSGASLVPLWSGGEGSGVLGAARRRSARMLVGSGLGLVVVLLLAPTKLPHHFGAMIIIGPLALMVLVALLQPRAGLSPVLVRRLQALLVAGAVATLGVAMHHDNRWWKLGTVGLLGDRRPPAVAGVPLWPLVLLVGVGLGVWLWRLPATAVRRTGVRSRAVLGCAVVLLVVWQYANFAQAAIRRGERYTMGSAAVAAMSGQGCRLERDLFVESQPARGMLPGQAASAFTGSGPEGLRVWQAGASHEVLGTGWFELPASVRQGQWPVVIAVRGMDERHTVGVEFDQGPAQAPRPTGRTLGTSDFTDLRIQPPAGAQRFRITARSQPEPSRAQQPGGRSGQGPGFAIANPRVPQVRPLLELAAEHQVAVAWNLAFFAPCLDTPAQSHGRVAVTDYILSDSAQPGNMSYTSRSGGPFAAVPGLGVPSRVPVYARGDHSEVEISALDLVRFLPAYGRLAEDPVIGAQQRWGWEAVPRVR